MNQLNPTSSFETLVDLYGWYAVSRLDGNPDLAAVAADARTAVLIWVRNRRSSKHYRTIFPGGLRGVIRTNSEEELQAARDVLTRMAGCQVPARKEAWSVVQATKVTLCQRYYGLYCQVVQIVGDPALAKTYFRPARRSSSPDVGEGALDLGELEAAGAEVDAAQAA